jgi:mono/diheme cytochrome c family protein
MKSAFSFSKGFHMKLSLRSAEGMLIFVYLLQAGIVPAHDHDSASQGNKPESTGAERKSGPEAKPGQADKTDKADHVKTLEQEKPVTKKLTVSIEEGRRLFVTNCTACHGAEGHGDGPAAIALNYTPRHFSHEAFRYISTSNGVPSDDDLTQTIRSGRRNAQMPAFPGFMDEEVSSLILYLREMNRMRIVENLKAKFKDKPDMTAERIDSISKKQTKPGEPVAWNPPSSDFRPDTEKGPHLFACNF